MGLPNAAFGLQSMLQRFFCCFGPQAAAKEYVDGGKAVFGPSVDAKVGFGQEQHAGYAAFAAEGVETAFEHGGTDVAGGVFQCGFQVAFVAQQFGRAAV